MRLKIDYVLDSDVSLKYQRSLPQVDRVLMAVIPLESATSTVSSPRIFYNNMVCMYEI